MILDNNKAQNRLDSPDNLANKIAAFRRQRLAPEVSVFHSSSDSDSDSDSSSVHIVESHTIEANKNSPRLSPESKEAIRDELCSGEKTQSQIAKDFGISDYAVHYQKKKMYAEADEENERLGLSTSHSRNNHVKETALNKLMLAMGLITEEKLSVCKATDLASVASDMAKVVDKVTPKAIQAPAVNLVVYAPKLNDESKYRVVEIGTANIERDA